jgi:hypothetical protein
VRWSSPLTAGATSLAHSSSSYPKHRDTREPSLTCWLVMLSRLLAILVSSSTCPCQSVTVIAFMVFLTKRLITRLVCKSRPSPKIRTSVTFRSRIVIGLENPRSASLDGRGNYHCEETHSRVGGDTMYICCYMFILLDSTSSIPCTTNLQTPYHTIHIHT